MHDLTAYIDEEGIGSGGFGDVFRAAHVATGKRVALKKSREDAIALERTKREIAVQRLRLHGNIMPVLDWAEDGSWFTMPLADGDVGLIRERWGGFRDADILRLVEDCASALGVAHRNKYVHRDLSPTNILWVDGRWLVADWGCVRLPDGTSPTQLTRAFSAMGTAAWASPEALADGRTVDERADVYSLGRIVGWLVSDSIPEVNRDFPLDPASPWASFVRETTRIDPSERPANVYEALTLLRPVLESLAAAREARDFTTFDATETSNVVVSAFKKYLVDPAQRITLDELLVRETEAVHARLSPEAFPVQTLATGSLPRRVERYAEEIAPLLPLIVAGCAHGEEGQASLWSKMVRRIGEPLGTWGGTTTLLHMRYLPASLLMHAGALAATTTERWYNFRAVTRDAKIGQPVRDESELAAVYAASLRESFDAGAAKEMPGMEQKYVPASEWLFATLRPHFKLLLPSDRDYENVFHRMEYIMALVYADEGAGAAPPARVTAADIRRRRYTGATTGTAIAAEVKASSDWGPIRGGLFGSQERVLKLCESLEKSWSTLGWF